MTPERWSQIEKLYHGALERAAGERAVYLTQACGSDKELRQEVESLLWQDDKTGDLLEAPAMEIAARAMAGEKTMSLAGKQLGSYQVVSRIGAGGMGEVYRARDTKLGREVAIKVLPPEFVEDAERLSRFRREAKLLASLNHPNIAMIYGLEDSGEIHFLVMELVEGQTLAARIPSGPIPVTDALKIGQQIAEALEHAHEHKVIHRDLKPANVILTKTGRIKVLDFGLAKALADESVASSDAVTVSLLPTEAGRIMGTPAYMSPEQAQGKPVDKQTDIWAFGCLLYELLTGQRAFPGENVSQTLASVLRSEPDWSTLPADTPAGVRQILQLCLEKDIARRRRDIRDLRLELETQLRGNPPAESIAALANLSRLKTVRRAAWGGAGLILLLATTAVVWYLKPSATQPVMHLNMNVAPADRLAGLGCPIVTLSPDGSRVAFIATHEGKRQMFVRALDSAEAQPVTGTEGAFCTPAFSPDGQWIAFYSDGQLKKIRYTGGTPTVLVTSIYGMSGMSWGEDDDIVYSSDSRGLQRVSAAGGPVAFVTKVDPAKGEILHLWPQVLPDAKAMLYTIASGERGQDAQIVAQSFATGERSVLVRGGSFGNYTPAGYLVYLSNGTMQAAPFDPKQLKITGAPTPASEDILQSQRGAAQYAFSSHGSLVYVPASQHVSELTKFVWVDRKGKEEELPVPPGAYESFSLSPDGSRLVLQLESTSPELASYDFRRDALTSLGPGYSPLWTHDGKKLIFGGSESLSWKPADGSGKQEQLLSEPGGVPTSLSPDGRLLAFWRVSETTGQDILMASSGNERESHPWLQTPANEAGATFSPDGRWIAYVSNESGRYEVYVRPLSGEGQKVQISSDGGGEPLWAPNGKELFYRNGDKMMVVTVSAGATLQVGRAQVLFQAPYLHRAGRFEFGSVNYQVAPDGQKFLMMKSAAPDSGATQINVVLNWFEELKQKVPVGK